MTTHTKPKRGRPKTNPLTLREQWRVAQAKRKSKIHIISADVPAPLKRAILATGGVQKEIITDLLCKGWLMTQIENDAMDIEDAEAQIARWKNGKD